MPVTEIGDPRLASLFGANDPREAGVRPTVRLPRQGFPAVALVAIAIVLALALFAVLTSRRTQQADPSVATRATGTSTGEWVAPPPLYLPPAMTPAQVVPQDPDGRLAQTLSAPVSQPVRQVAVPTPTPFSPPAPMLSIAPVPGPPTRPMSTGSSLVIDTGRPADGSGTPRSASAASEIGTEAVVRMRASAFANPSMTVPQGYLIPAVLETGFDSTKPGYARAIVSRDVRGFDGRNVLIPRGSRLIGQYRSATGQSQDRATITWTRLIRPDGMTIALDSPAVDPQGRGGVPASANTHFFARLGNALLQSTFAVGQALAGRATTGPVVVLQGGATNTAAQIASPVTDYTPTLKVKPGKSISIFVAQDLDFGAAREQG